MASRSRSPKPLSPKAGPRARAARRCRSTGAPRTPPRPGRAAAGGRSGCRQRWPVVGRWTTCRSRQQTEQAEPPSTAEAHQGEAQNNRTAPQRPSWCFIGPMCRQLPSSSLRSADPSWARVNDRTLVETAMKACRASQGARQKVGITKGRKGDKAPRG